MNIALIGLGKMGLGIAERLIKKQHTVYGFDYNDQARQAAQDIGVFCTNDIATLAKHASVFWLMVPAGQPVDDVINLLIPAMQPHDIVIDGGNSFFKDSIRRHTLLSEKNMSFLDCGTSGGMHGKDLGYCLMIGGDVHAFEKIKPITDAIAMPEGIVYTGPAGSGHYVKMVHNGIEYALLQAYAEGFHLLKEGTYKDLPLADIAQTWNHGSIVRSWILHLLENVLKNDTELKDVSGYIAENKTGAWSSQTAREHNIPLETIQKSLDIRAWSRISGGNYATKLVALMRHEFGGHAVKKIDE